MRKPWPTRVLLLLLQLWGGASCYGQATVVISGSVRDAKTGESLLGASVVLRGQRLGTSAEPDGFSLACPRSELPDTLAVSYVGYRTKRLLVVPHANLQLAVTLQPATQVQLAQVEVTAKQPIAEDFVIQKLDYLKIVTNPAASADPLRAVNALPAATTVDESASVSLRGSDPSQTGIYLNNAPIYDAVKFAQLSGIGTFSIFNPALVKSLLVFPSNPPLEFGNAGAGLIAISTEEKRGAPSLEVGLGLANSGFFAGLPVGQQGMLKLYGNFQSGRLLRAVNPRAFADLASLGLGESGLHYARPLGRHGTLKLFGYGISEAYGYRYTAPSVADVYQYRKQRGFYVANYEYRFKKADLSVSQAANLSLAHTAVGNYASRQRNLDGYGSAAFRYYWSAALTSRAGVSYDRRALQIDGQFPLYSYALSPAAPTVEATLTPRRTLWEAYQYTKLNLTSWTFGAGLRQSLPGAAFSYFSYQANARYNISERQFVNLAGGQYHAVTTPDALAYPFQLVRTRQVALDYSYTHSPWTVTAALYLKRETGRWPANIAGGEAYAQRSFGKWLTGDVSVASVRVRADTNSGGTGLFYSAVRRDLPFSLKTSWQATFAWLNLGMITQYRSGAPYTPVAGSSFDSQLAVYRPLYGPTPDAARLPDYFRTDVLVNRVFKLRKERTSLLVYASLNNVFDVRNVSSYSYNADYSVADPNYFQKRSLYIGMVLSLL